MPDGLTLPERHASKTDAASVPASLAEKPLETEIAPGTSIMFSVTSPMSLDLIRPVATALLDHDCQVSILVGSGEIPSWTSMMNSVVQIDLLRRPSLLALPGALAQSVTALRSIRPDVVIAATPQAALLSMMGARLAGVPCRIFHVWGCRWESMNGLGQFVVKLADRVSAWAATEVLVVSPSLRDLLAAHRIGGGKLVVLGSGAQKGVDLTRFKPADRKVDLCNPVLGYVGRLAADKGVDELLEIFDLVSARYPSARLVICGDQDESDPIADGLISRIREDPRVDWTHWTPDVAETLREVDILVFPSRREGLPNAVIEAAAMGIPAVVARSTGSVDAIEEGVTGFSYAVGSPTEAATRVLQVIQEPERYEHLSWQARQFAEAHFDQDEVIDRLMKHVARRTDGTLR